MELFFEICEEATTKEIILLVMFLCITAFIILSIILEAIWHFIKSAVSHGVKEGIEKANNTTNT